MGERINNPLSLKRSIESKAEQKKMTAWGKSVDVDSLPKITSADRDMIYVLPDGTDWLSDRNWRREGETPVWRRVFWAFGMPCPHCSVERGLCDGCNPDMHGAKKTSG